MGTAIVKLLVVSGSLRPGSTNTLLLRAAEKLKPVGMDIKWYEGLGSLPHFNPELDVEDAVPAVADWRARLREADALLICTPEYAGNIPGSLKNAIDWIVSSAELNRKPVAIISASPSVMGGDKALASLQLTLTMLDAFLPEGAAMAVPAATRKVSADGVITDPATADQLKSLLAALGQAAHTQRKRPSSEEEGRLQ